MRLLVRGEPTVPGPRDEQHCQFCLDPPSSQSVLGPSELWPTESAFPHLIASVISTELHGSLVSSPYSFSCKRVPKDAEDQLEAASGAAAAIGRVHAVPYSIGRLCSQLYAYDFLIYILIRSFRNVDLTRTSSAPGNAVDWMYQRRGIRYSFAVHLRDTGTVSLNRFGP